MLLRVGVAMMLSAIALAAAVAGAVSLFGAREEVASQAASVQPQENQATAQEKGGYDPGKRLEIDQKPKEKPQKSPEPQPLPVPSASWPEPSGEESAAAEAPRYYQPQRDSTMTLTVEAIGLFGVPVINSLSQEAMDNGVVHFPQTPFPWEEREQKNVYLAGHRLGWPGTGSRLVFYNLDKLKKGDRVELKDSLGNAYEYRVSEVFVADPNATWAVQPVRGRDMVTLQTCTFPDLVNRLIVRADRA